MPGLRERTVDSRGMGAQRRRRAGRLGRLLRQPQILQHQRRGKAGRVIAVGGRRRHRPRHRAITGQRPALARRRRGDIEQRLVRSAPAFPPARTPRDTPIMEMPSIMLLQIFAACPAPARRHGRCSCPSPRGSACRGERRLRAADHEGQRRGLGAADAAGHRRVQHSQPALRRQRVGRRALSTSMVEQSISSGRAAPPRSTSRQHRAHVLAGRQHGDDDLGALDRFGRGGGVPPPSAWPRPAMPPTRSNPVTVWPALTRLAAIGPPMLPRPMKAIFVMCVPCCDAPR